MSLHAFVFTQQPKKEHFDNVFWIYFFFEAKYTNLPPSIVFLERFTKSSFAVLHSNRLGILEITHMLSTSV